MLKTTKLNYKNILFYNDIHIHKDKINFITGESGCGKSTLLKLFNRTENLTTGEILYKNRNITEFDTIELRKKIKLISQTSFLFSGTIRDNFNLFYQYCQFNMLTDDQMNYFLELTEIYFSLDTICDHLSGGEKQRVYIAICLSMKAETIMLDEPTSALNFDLSVKVIGNIISYVKSNNLCLIIISHDNKLTEKFGENVIDLTGGRKYE